LEKPYVGEKDTWTIYLNGARNESRNGTGVVLLTLGDEYPLPLVERLRSSVLHTFDKSQIQDGSCNEKRDREGRVSGVASRRRAYKCISLDKC